MTTNVWKLEILVIDHENFTKEIVESVFEQIDSFSVRVLKAEVRSVEWTDNHPLNSQTKWEAAVKDLFGA